METLKAILKRTSVRGYKSDQIPCENLDTILKSGCAAPVGYGDYDSLHMTLIQNSDLLNKISKNAATAMNKPDTDPLYGAPTLVLISSNGSKSPNIEYSNAACIIENMALTATDFSISSVYLWGIISPLISNKELLKELNLPDGFKPISALALGYPIEDVDNEKELSQKIKLNIIK